MALNPKVKEAWCNALRSGEYEQATSRLRVNHFDGHGDVVGQGHCCLGVLLDVIDPDGWTTWDDEGYDPLPYHRTYVNGDPVTQDMVLDDAVLYAIGLNNTQQNTLTSMNDDEGADFYEIADYIEANL